MYILAEGVRHRDAGQHNHAEEDRRICHRIEAWIDSIRTTPVLR